MFFSLLNVPSLPNVSHFETHSFLNFRLRVEVPPLRGVAKTQICGKI